MELQARGYYKELPKESVRNAAMMIARAISSTKTAKGTFYQWAMSNYKIDSRLLSLDRFLPLARIYQDNHPDITIMKSAQSGLSEYLIAYSFYFAINYPENVFYAMPAKDQIKDFVQGRVDPRIDDSNYLQELIVSTDNMDLKRVGLNLIYYRGSQNRRQITTVDAGCLILDEVDDMIQSNIPVMEKRLGASRFKIKRRVGVPSSFEHGVHREYLMTDQHEYFLKCPACGEWQIPSWEKNIWPEPTRDKNAAIPEVVKLICHKCQAELNRQQPGEWRAQNPEAERRGYRVSKLIMASTDLRELWIEYQNTINLQDFFNGNLGMPYAVAGGKLDDSILNACRENYKIEKLDNCSMGVDVGALLNVRISKRDGNKKRAAWIGTLKIFEELDQKMKQFDVGCCVIDGLPETREAVKFAKRFSGRVYLAYYAGDDPNKTFELKNEDYEKQQPAKVIINRVRAMDETANRFIERENIIPMNANTIPSYYDQLKAPQRVKIIDKNGNERYTYVENNKADHYFHAEVYDEIASRSIRTYQIFAV